MEKKIVTIIALSTLAIGLNACMDMRSPTSLAPGEYDRTTSSTDANGTTTERQTSTTVDVDNKGHKKAVVKSKVTKDPKGLLNKTTTSETREEIQDVK